MSLLALVANARQVLLDPPVVPDPGAHALPPKVASVFDTVIGIGISIAAGVAVVCLVGAGIMLMFGETGHGSPGGKFVKILGGLGIVLGAGAFVGFIVT